MRHSLLKRGRWLPAGVLAFILGACAGSGGVSPAPPQPGHASGKDTSRSLENTDRQLMALVRMGNFQLALKKAQALRSSGQSEARIVGDYWSAMSLVFLENTDSALAILKKRRGQWGGMVRETQAEALLRALKSDAAPCPELKPAPARNTDQAQALIAEQRIAELQFEVDRLMRETRRYEKLLSELDRLP